MKFTVFFLISALSSLSLAAPYGYEYWGDNGETKTKTETKTETMTKIKTETETPCAYTPKVIYAPSVTPTPTPSHVSNEYEPTTDWFNTSSAVFSSSVMYTSSASASAVQYSSSSAVPTYSAGGHYHA